MQSTPHRLSQTIWAVFRAAKPLCHPSLTEQFPYSRYIHTHTRKKVPWAVQPRISLRFYSERARNTDVEKKVAAAKDRIDDALDARAESAANAGSPLRQRNDETIVHANPESSSIVHEKETFTPSNHDAPKGPPGKNAPLPSEKADVRSQMTTRFSHFMDDFQSKIFVASQRLNDLTGYTGIERLKREIDQQESSVQAARQAVKDSRTEYSGAIAMRSATQREVNDLLQRKHAWSPEDLERFTNLYRSDHANEQAEQQAHQKLSDAEVRYEEASTKLAKSILARYHEEQIWSDKIRQMSTWGTWGLMGLNVLLFVLLQLAIEPWRRRRLVRGFEEKVEVALASREQENQELRAQLRERSGGDVVATAVAARPEPVVAAAGEQLAEAIVDAITGSTDRDPTIGSPSKSAQKEAIETAAEQVTTKEIREEVAQGGSPDVPVLKGTSSSVTQSAWSRFPASIYTGIVSTCTNSYDTFRRQFDTTSYVVLSRRQITANFVEGLAAGVALAAGAMFILARNR